MCRSAKLVELMTSLVQDPVQTSPRLPRGVQVVLSTVPLVVGPHFPLLRVIIYHVKSPHWRYLGGDLNLE